MTTRRSNRSMPARVHSGSSRIAPATPSAPGKWLYPFSSVGGPNNQYLQLILAALAAKASGRTLLLAPFVRWSRDAGSSFAHNFSSTFDARALARFVSVQHVTPRTFGFSAVTRVVTAGGTPSAANFKTLCFAAGLPCDSEALWRSVAGVGHDAISRCKGRPKPDGSYMRCLLAPWADRPTLGFSAWGVGKVKVRAHPAWCCAALLRRSACYPVPCDLCPVPCDLCPHSHPNPNPNPLAPPVSTPRCA